METRERRRDTGETEKEKKTYLNHNNNNIVVISRRTYLQSTRFLFEYMCPYSDGDVSSIYLPRTLSISFIRFSLIHFLYLHLSLFSIFPQYTSFNLYNWLYFLSIYFFNFLFIGIFSLVWMYIYLSFFYFSFHTLHFIHMSRCIFPRISFQ